MPQSKRCTPLIFSFSSCTNYEPQPWSCWRQDGCFPYYSESVAAPINTQLDLPSIQTDASSSSCTNGATECNQSSEQPKFSEGKGTLPKSHPQEGTAREPIAERFYDNILFYVLVVKHFKLKW